MGVKSRLTKLEAIRTNRKKVFTPLIWLDGKPTLFKDKMYNNYEELLQEYPTLENDYDINNIIITYE